MEKDDYSNDESVMRYDEKGVMDGGTVGLPRKINREIAIEAGRMMVKYLGEKDAAYTIEAAVVSACTTVKSMTAGKMGYSTSGAGDLIVEYIKNNM